MARPEGNPNTISSNELEQSAQIASEIRQYVEAINKRLIELNVLGFANARITWSDATRKIEFAASRTTEFKL